MKFLLLLIVFLFIVVVSLVCHHATSGKVSIVSRTFTDTTEVFFSSIDLGRIPSDLKVGDSVWIAIQTPAKEIIGLDRELLYPEYTMSVRSRRSVARVQPQADTTRWYYERARVVSVH